MEEGVKMNPIFYALAAEASTIDYIETIGTTLIVLYLINKVGEVKMILGILVVSVAIVAAFYVIPTLNESDLFPMVNDFVNSIPAVLGDLIGKIGGII